MKPIDEYMFCIILKDAKPQLHNHPFWSSHHDQSLLPSHHKFGTIHNDDN